MSPRPQRDVPGFEGSLTVCSDWPPTKKGQAPSAQSAIFNPLLACVLGEIEGYCSAEEVAIATAWWTVIMPAWPRWIEELRAAGVGRQYGTLMRSISKKASTNPLIFKRKGWGTTNQNPSVPHFSGKAQNAALEMAPMVEIEVFACVTILYQPES